MKEGRKEKGKRAGGNSSFFFFFPPRGARVVCAASFPLFFFLVEFLFSFFIFHHCRYLIEASTTRQAARFQKPVSRRSPEERADRAGPSSDSSGGSGSGAASSWSRGRIARGRTPRSSGRWCWTRKRVSNISPVHRSDGHQPNKLQPPLSLFFFFFFFSLTRHAASVPRSLPGRNPAHQLPPPPVDIGWLLSAPLSPPPRLIAAGSALLFFIR